MQKVGAPSCFTMLMISALILIIYNEYLEFYLLKQSQWAHASRSIQYPTSSTDRNDTGGHDPVRLLIVGDPQIQGYRDEPAILGYVTRWDSDSYLSKYFQEALSFVKPDLIITMGDLIDEGSIATDREFDIYAERFKRLFRIPRGMKSTFVHLSGDNDIGGEGDDPVMDYKIRRFEKHFGPITEAVLYKHLAIYKLNILPYAELSSEDGNRQMEHDLNKMAAESRESTVRIVVTHVALANAMLFRHIQILRTLRPQYTFSAHTHHSGFVSHHLAKLMDSYKTLYKPSHVKELTEAEKGFSNDEYKIPGCSYRIGVEHMAYAMAVIDPDGGLHYTLLGLPSRFKQLYRYIMFIIFVGIVLGWKAMTSVRWRR